MVWWKILLWHGKYYDYFTKLQWCKVLSWQFQILECRYKCIKLPTNKLPTDMSANMPPTWSKYMYYGPYHNHIILWYDGKYCCGRWKKLWLFNKTAVVLFDLLAMLDVIVGLSAQNCQHATCCSNWHVSCWHVSTMLAKNYFNLYYLDKIA